MNNEIKSLSPEDLKKAEELLIAIKKDKNSELFLEPVDWKGKQYLYSGLGLDDYPVIVKNPMDLLTVKSKIDKRIYTSLEDVMKDIELIWSNCKLYNVEGSVKTL